MRKDGVLSAAEIDAIVPPPPPKRQHHSATAAAKQKAKKSDDAAAASGGTSVTLRKVFWAPLESAAYTIFDDAAAAPGGEEEAEEGGGGADDDAGGGADGDGAEDAADARLLARLRDVFAVKVVKRELSEAERRVLRFLSLSRLARVLVGGSVAFPVGRRWCNKRECAMAAARLGRAVGAIGGALKKGSLTFLDQRRWNNIAIKLKQATAVFF